MKARGLVAIAPKNFIPRTSDGRANAPSLNLLTGRRAPTSPNQVWIADITFIPTASGWLYLAVVIDLYSRRIVGWHLADHLRGALVIAALDQALKTRRPPPELIFHSDRGSQFASIAFRQALLAAGIIQSMSRRANPYDNAWTESFMGTLKRVLQGGTFEDARDAFTEIFDYIEGYYNIHRKHSALHYFSPSQFERSHQPSN